VIFLQLASKDYPAIIQSVKHKRKRNETVGPATVRRFLQTPSSFSSTARKHTHTKQSKGIKHEETGGGEEKREKKGAK
jgi:hypothetical protein